MDKLIEPRTLRGFRDYPPQLMIPREQLLEKARQVYRSYGFAPIDTPALEYSEILLGKGGDESDRLIYRFKDHGDRDVALRFDLTVPFARFAAQHIGQLGVPFKRYHLGPVWRGENNAHGRYREFWQCDFDTIGTTSNAADLEVALVIHDLFLALGFEKFCIHINNRLVLNGLLEAVGLAGKATPILRALDKLPKIGAEKVCDEMVREASATADQAKQILSLTSATGPALEVLQSFATQYPGNARMQEGISKLRELFAACAEAGVPAERMKLDLSIARGLDYYTGTIFETFLTENPKIGSVCSGGRYDNLAGLYTKQALPGVGASLGLDRLLAAMEELGMLPQTATPAPLLIVQFSADFLGKYQALARSLRAQGLGTEVYPEPKKLGQQLTYAEKRGCQIALIAGPDEFSAGTINVRHLATRKQETVALTQVADVVRKLLSV